MVQILMQLGEGFLRSLFHIKYRRDGIEKEAPHSFLKNLITKLNAENPHMFRAMIVCLYNQRQIKQSFLVTPLIALRLWGKDVA
ncbi:hypothetical protein V6N13_010941 [Hibiscus sabdariffa]